MQSRSRSRCRRAESSEAPAAQRSYNGTDSVVVRGATDSGLPWPLLLLLPLLMRLLLSSLLLAALPLLVCELCLQRLMRLSNAAASGPL